MSEEKENGCAKCAERKRSTATPMMDSPMMTGVVAGVLIAGAILYTGGGLSSSNGFVSSAKPTPQREAAEPRAKVAAVTPDNVKVRPVTDQDRVLGQRDAAVKIIEFSDLECPYCRRFHPNVKRAVEEYGSDKVAAVYRHFPLDQIHPNARREAMAAECVADQKGDGAFWSYVDKIFAAKDPKNSADGKPKSLTVEDLTAMAESLGVARSDFSACLTGEKFADKVETDKKDAISAGGRGTPYTVVIAPNGENFVLSGARSYGDLSRIVDQALTLRK